MVDWQATAITVHCDAIGGEVTIIVYKDWSARCTGCADCDEVGKAGNNSTKKGNRAFRKRAKCAGHQCERLIEYRNRLRSQELK